MCVCVCVCVYSLFPVSLVDAGDLGYERVIWVWVTEQRADRQEDCGGKSGVITQINTNMHTANKQTNTYMQRARTQKHTHTRDRRTEVLTPLFTQIFLQNKTLTLLHNVGEFLFLNTVLQTREQ